MAHAWKACWVQALMGSNPIFSAVKNAPDFRQGHFDYRTKLVQATLIRKSSAQIPIPINFQHAEFNLCKFAGCKPRQICRVLYCPGLQIQPTIYRRDLDLHDC